LEPVGEHLKRISLSIRFSISSILGTGIRSLLVVSTVALSSALLLTAITIPQAVEARGDRELALIPIESLGDDKPASYSVVQEVGGEFRGVGFSRTLISMKGADPPLPPGVIRPLRPGEVAASPSLGRLLMSPAGSLLRPRFPGDVVATIGSEGLLYPDELRGYVGVSRSQLRQGTIVVDFGPDPSTLGEGPPLSLGVWIATLLMMLGIALPILVLLHTATRLSAASRDSRFAALRLIGATRGQVSTTAASDTAILAVVGSLAAIPVFLAARGWVAGVLPQPYQWFPSDLAWSPATAAGVTVGVTLLSAVVTFASMRRVMVTPLGVVREPSRASRRPTGLSLLAAGLVALVSASFLVEDSLLQLGAVALGLVGTSLGAVLLMPWVGSQVAAFIGRRTGRPGILLGAHWITGDPGATGRITAGFLVVMLLVGVGQAIALSVRASELRLLPDWVFDGRPSSLFVDAYRPGKSFADMLESVSGVINVRTQSAGLSGETGHHYAVVLTDGTPDTKERIRNALAWSASASVSSGADIQQDVLGSSHRTAAIVSLGGEFGLLVIGFGFLITAIERTVAQRRPLAAIRAIGASSHVLRSACLTQALVPVATAVILGASLSLVVTVLLFHAVCEDLDIPFRTICVMGGMASLIVLLVTGATNYRLRGLLVSPGALRAE
jgi:predicted lysophospholipase L1 biosynthesis ABC-type transport system permease subunit